MVSSWENLPQELLRAIFTSAKPSLLQLQLTCRSWSKMAKEVFYQEISIVRSNTSARLEKLTESFLQPNNETPDLVKSVHFGYCQYTPLITRILSLCPNLTHIDATSITSQLEVKNLFDILYNVRSSGCLQKLKVVRYPLCLIEDGDLVEKYNKATFACKDTLTHLQLVDGSTFSRPYNTPPQHFIEAFDRLTEFPQLKSMKITLECIAYLYEMDSFIQKLDQKIDTLSITLRNTRVLRPVESLNYTNIMPRKHLKHLKIKIERLEAEDLEYIMNKFPELVSLKICIMDGGGLTILMMNLDTTHTFNIMARFFGYVATLRSYKLDWITIATARLRSTLSDIQKSIQITELTISDNVPIVPSTQLCISPRHEPGIERAACMFLMTTQQQQHRKSFYEYTLGLMRESIRELKIECFIDKEDLRYDERLQQERAAACHVQGDAIIFALNTLPNLRSLIAKYAVMTTMPSTINSAGPRLTLDVLTLLGADIHADAYCQMSLRISDVKKFTAGSNLDDGKYQPENYSINMPHTTFGEIRIMGWRQKNCILKLFTTRGITYYRFGSTSFSITSDDYDNWTPNNYNLIKVTIRCASVKSLAYVLS